MKIWEKGLIALGIAGAVALLAAGYFGFLDLTADEPPLDDSDLRVERLDIPDDQNAFTYFEQVAQVLYWPGYEPPEDEDEEGGVEWAGNSVGVEQDEAEKEKAELLDRMLEGEIWDATLATGILECNKETLTLFEKAMACPHFQFPQIYSIDAAMPYVFHYLKVANLIVLRSRALMKDGRQEGAFDEAMKLVRFGHRIEGAKGCLVAYLVGSCIKGMGHEELRRLIPRTALASDRLRKYADRLTAFRADKEGLADIFRVEYQVCANMVDDLKRGKMSLEGLMGVGTGPLAPGNPISDYRLKPNETKRMFARAFRVHIDAVGKPWPEAAKQMEAWKRAFETSRAKAVSNPLAALYPNAVGNAVFFMMVPGMSGVLKTECRADVSIEATRVLLVLKAHQLDKGRLPETLEELVPAYIDAVPLDDFDGKPMRYNPEKRVIYSVGADLKDDGGMTKEEQEVWWKDEYPYRAEEGDEPNIWQMPDPSWMIEF